MKKLLLVFCLLFVFAEAHVSNWPLRPSADLRDDAMKQIKAFTENFPQDAAVTRAKEILADETLQKDMHAWMRPTMDLALEILDRHPVSPDNEAIRKAALIILDYQGVPALDKAETALLPPPMVVVEMTRPRRPCYPKIFIINELMIVL